MRGDVARATLVFVGEVFANILRVGVGEWEEAAVGPRTEVFFLIDKGSTFVAAVEVASAENAAGLGVESSWSVGRKGIRLLRGIPEGRERRDGVLLTISISKTSSSSDP